MNWCFVSYLKTIIIIIILFYLFIFIWKKLELFLCGLCQNLGGQGLGVIDREVG